MKKNKKYELTRLILQNRLIHQTFDSYRESLITK